MTLHLPSVPSSEIGGTEKHHPRYFLSTGRDNQILGVLLILAGTFDLMWIVAYPHYALKVLGTTLFSGRAGESVK